jgi:hypothetical protein
MFRPLRAILRRVIQLVIISVFKDYFNTRDPLHVCNMIIGMLFVVIGFSTYSPNTCYRIKYKNKNCKISKIPRY